MAAYEKELHAYEEKQSAYRLYQKQLEDIERAEQQAIRHEEGLKKWEADNQQTIDRQKKVEQVFGYNKQGIKAPPLPQRSPKTEEVIQPPVATKQTETPPPLPTRPVIPQLPGKQQQAKHCLILLISIAYNPER